MSRAPRTLYLPMDEVLDIMESGDDSPRFLLDTQAGTIEMELGEGGVGLPAPAAPWVEIPRWDRGQDRVVLEAFAFSVDEPEARAALTRALRGPEPIADARAALALYPELALRWQRERRAALLQTALAWLGTLGIAPSFELRPLPTIQPLGRAAAAVGQARVGLFDFLLLGTRDDAGVPTGSVRRIFVAADRAQARRIFARIARELTEHHGQTFRPDVIDGRDELVVASDRQERCTLSLRGRQVELVVALSPALRAAFGIVADS